MAVHYQNAGHTMPSGRTSEVPQCLEGADSAVFVGTKMPSHGEPVSLQSEIHKSRHYTGGLNFRRLNFNVNKRP